MPERICRAVVEAAALRRVVPEADLGQVGCRRIGGRAARLARAPRAGPHLQPAIGRRLHLAVRQRATARHWARSGSAGTGSGLALFRAPASSSTWRVSAPMSRHPAAPVRTPSRASPRRREAPLGVCGGPGVWPLPEEPVSLRPSIRRHAEILSTRQRTTQVAATVRTRRLGQAFHERIGHGHIQQVTLGVGDQVAGRLAGPGLGSGDGDLLPRLMLGPASISGSGPSPQPGAYGRRLLTFRQPSGTGPRPPNMSRKSLRRSWP